MRLRKLDQLHMVNAMHTDPNQLRASILRELTQGGGEESAVARDVSFFEGVRRSVEARKKAKL